VSMIAIRNRQPCLEGRALRVGTIPDGASR
jgi:hypothetical protein